MTFVVMTESCIRRRFTDCMEVCPPTLCFGNPSFLAIDPAECIDRTLRVPERPVGTIFAEVDVPPDRRAFTALIAKLTEERESRFVVCYRNGTGGRALRILHPRRTFDPPQEH